jgi:hypothetical protein
MNFELVNYSNYDKNLINKIMENIDDSIIIYNNHKLYDDNEIIINFQRKIKSENNNINLSDRDIILIIHILFLSYIFFNYFNKSKI